jgi:predicted nucleotidyltransferase component of viral defense system
MVASIIFKLDELRDYAGKSGMGLNFVVKEAFLFELMEEMEGTGFVLKGGTAINKGYLEGHQRFSEDLDYDTGHSKEEAKSIIKGLGWKLKKEFFTKNSIGFMLQYEFSGIKDVVRLDISFGIKGKSRKRRAASDFIPVSKLVTMYEFEALNLQKERAFEERYEWKDIYDLYWMHELYPNDFKISNTAEFEMALSKTSVPKTANAYIPVSKRINWNEMIARLSRRIL